AARDVLLDPRPLHALPALPPQPGLAGAVGRVDDPAQLFGPRRVLQEADPHPSPRSRPTASATAAREETPSFANTRLMWLSTVFSERNSSPAISRFVRPSATRSATSRSRPL